MIACQTAADFFAPTAPELVFLAGGEFLMGALPDDKFADDTVRPVHHVNVAAFALGKFPVTVGEYRQFSPDHAPGDPAAWPVVNVSWNSPAAPARRRRLPAATKSRRTTRIIFIMKTEHASARGGARR